MARIVQRSAVFVFVVLLALVPLAVASAAGGIRLWTPYPGVDIEPGHTTTFTLHLTNGSGAGQTVRVGVDRTPAGWSAVLKATGDLGLAVHEVYVDPGETQDVQLQVRAPDEAKPGEYAVVVTAATPSGAVLDTLDLSLRIASGGGQGPALSADYPALQGSPDATFEFSLTLENRSLAAETFRLAAQAPDGWQVTFHPSYDSKQINTIKVDAGGSQTLTVDVNPPHGVKAGTYTIPVTASAGAGQSATVQLGVTITGSYSLSVTTPDGRLNATAAAGRPTHVSLLVKNSGTADAQGVSLTADAPPGWKVEFSPAQVDVPAQGQQQVTATITPDAKAIAGDYDVTVTASASQSSASQDIRVTVETSTLWGIVGLIVVLGVVGGLLYTFKVYGRR
ncbi:MAG: alpha-galactosidase [Firmicutes bacterium]|nr:alpha-galactosidase [Bacillota bacterium]